MKRFTFVVALVVTALLATNTAHAQGLQTGTLSGVVKDPDGLPLPGATVTVTSSVLQGERTAVTDAIGAYIIRGLPPGTYVVRFQFTGTSAVQQTAAVPLGGLAELNTTMRLAGVQEAVQVTATTTPPPLAQTQVSTNFTAETINALPVGRRPFEIAELAPGVTDNTPNVGQLAVGGAFAFDSIFLIDGVDTNDNLFGNTNNLFVEDAIAETQVLTSGISAEFGRFGGGVVNVITRSGGNEFHGSFRANYAKPSWSVETPFENTRTPPVVRGTILSKFYEGTVGGPIFRNRLWFFNADRYEVSATSRTFPELGGSYNDGVQNKRFELKLTGTPIVNHTVSGSFLTNPTENTSRPSINADMSIEASTLVDRTLPNKLWVVNWNGVLTSKLFATFQFSKKDQGFRNTGGTETAITSSPFLTRGNFGVGVAANRHYNAPYFSSRDPEDRNNQQVAASLSYFVTSPSLGRHDFKVGGERFNSWRTGGNSQSATGYVFLTDYRNVGGVAQPIWEPAANGTRTRIQQWLAYPGSTLDIFTTSIYVQDRWQARGRVTADLGLRFEAANTEATGGIVGADTTAWLPRLGVSVDIEGNGRTVAQATYGRYSGRFTERAFARNTNVGTPSRVDLAYVGPAGQGKDFAPGFNLANYVIVGGNFPTANVFFDESLRSPKTNEFTLSLGRQLSRGHIEGVYIWRRTGDFIEDFIDNPTAAGKTTVTRDGVTYGVFDNVMFRNTDAPRREYQALQFAGRANVERFAIHSHYTIQIKNHGNFEGEAANQPGNSSIWFDYPEMLPENRYYPYGRLDEFQRHKFRMWTIWTQSLGRAGTVDVSPLWRVNSGLTYSHAASGIGPTAIQIARNPGYARANTTTSTLFFGERGSESFKGYGMLDMSFRYGVPVWKSVQPWIQANVFNVLNNRKQIAWNTTVTPDPASPRDSNGQPTGFIKGSLYGQATANTHFPAWSSGETGGRTFRMAMGIRF